MSRACVFLCVLFAVTFPASAQTDSNAAPAPTVQTAPSAPDAPVTSQVVTPNGQNTGQPQPQEEIDDIRPPLFFFHPVVLFMGLLAVAAFIALLVLAWKWLSRSPFISPKTAYELTLDKLNKARELLREDAPMPYAVFISETIRSYLGLRFQSPSTRRTTEEFLRLMEADPNTPLAEHRELLKDFLLACDMVKFARYQPTLAELEEVQQSALTFVTATKPSPEENRPNGRKP